MLSSLPIVHTSENNWVLVTTFSRKKPLDMQSVFHFYSTLGSRIDLNISMSVTFLGVPFWHCLIIVRALFNLSLQFQGYLRIEYPMGLDTIFLHPTYTSHTWFLEFLMKKIYPAWALWSQSQFSNNKDWLLGTLLMALWNKKLLFHYCLHKSWWSLENDKGSLCY